MINCLRMRPDRIIVGECRGKEALDMLQAMNTGHDGCMTTVHSNSPRDALSRIETMSMMARADLPLRAIREQIAAAFDLIVYMERLEDGSRKVTYITEVQGFEQDTILLQDVFHLDWVRPRRPARARTGADGHPPAGDAQARKGRASSWRPISSSRRPNRSPRRIASGR